MSNVIDLTIDHFRARKTNAFVFAKVESIKTDLNVYASFLKSLLTEYLEHLEDNKSKLELIDEDYENFLSELHTLTCHVEFVVSHDNNISNDEKVTELKQLRAESFTAVIDWFDMLDIPFKQAQVINIKNYVGAK